MISKYFYILNKYMGRLSHWHSRFFDIIYTYFIIILYFFQIPYEHASIIKTDK